MNIEVATQGPNKYREFQQLNQSLGNGKILKTFDHGSGAEQEHHFSALIQVFDIQTAG